MSIQPELPALAPDPEAWKLYVFRKSRVAIDAQTLLAGLKADLQAISTRSGAVLDALVKAGEIETGLADAQSLAAAAMGCVVDHLASVACGYQQLDPSRLQSVENITVPAAITCSHPEGFSYYGLNPLDFADLAWRAHPELRTTVSIIGIRSVGSTLGAVVAAALRASGTQAERITLRPEGEPYDRRASFGQQQEDWIRAGLERNNDFVIVDEGPGFSGSTFLSVVRALVEAGVPPSHIVLMGSRPFAARVAGTQSTGWNLFRHFTIDYASRTPATAARSLGDGAWRELLYPESSDWPACWVEQERIKLLASDGQILFKFEGFGRFGHLARMQSESLAHEKFSPRTAGCDQGYIAYEFVRGRPMTANDLSRDLLTRMAAYCAYRAREFAAPSYDFSLLRSMARVNLEIELGTELRDFELDIPLEKPVYPDCRMLPHEWLLSTDGHVLKTDGVGHGDGHQFPGPTDIAWDLAGAVVEWSLTQAETEFFLDQYRRHSGDDASGRLTPYVLLYTVLRSAQCRMASASLSHTREAGYLYRQYLGYAQQVKMFLNDYLVFR